MRMSWQRSPTCERRKWRTGVRFPTTTSCSQYIEWTVKDPNSIPVNPYKRAGRCGECMLANRAKVRTRGSDSWTGLRGIFLLTRVRYQRHT